MRARPIRPNVYHEIKRCGVYQGDWKYILDSDRRRLHPAVRFRLVDLLHSARRSLGRVYIRRYAVAVHVFKSQQTERLALSQTRRGNRRLEQTPPTSGR